MCRMQRGMASRHGAPTLPDTRQQVMDAVTAYQIVSMSEGVVQRGTATVIADLGYPARRQDRHHQRLQGRLVHRLSRRTSSSACGPASIRPRHGRRRNRRPHRGADLPRLHARSAARHASRRRSGFRPACAWCASMRRPACCRMRHRRRRSWKRSGRTPSRRAMWRPRRSCSAAPIRSIRACSRARRQRSTTERSSSNAQQQEQQAEDLGGLY